MSTHTIAPQPLALRHQVGDLIKERYTVREVLGSGAFGTVYRIEETIGARLVVRACKEMHVLNNPDTALDERADALRMFQEEAYLLETLRNQHIPAAHFELEKGFWLACPICGLTFSGVTHCPDHNSTLEEVKERYYLLMDFIEGDDLEEKLVGNSGRPLAETEVLEWALQVCEALQAVHAKGFSHRDIKPANIKIQNESAQAMLIDFGLVRPSTMAGSYGTVLKRTSTGAGTIGYAPPSLDEQARPDARTDILALGMTLYRLLSTRDPTEPADLEEMRRNAPRHFNAALSPLIETIIVKAIQPDPERRYANINELRNALRAARYPYETTCASCGWLQRSAQRPDDATACERCGRPVLPPKGITQPVTMRVAPSPPPLAPIANPYEARIKQIEADLTLPPPRGASNFDARIGDIEKLLAPISHYAGNGGSDKCPSCHTGILANVTGQPTGQCPLCRQAQLRRRPLDPSLCPICREPGFGERSLGEGELFCPVCRVEVLHEERRRRFGGAGDVHCGCPRCGAMWEGPDAEVALLEFRDDPYGVGAQYHGRKLPWSQWRHLSGRADRYAQCKNCWAQFDEPQPNNLSLFHFTSDPHGVAERTRGATLTRAAWAKIAQGLATTVGTHHCPNCHGEFNYERGAHTMTLLDAPAQAPDWAQRWRGLSVSLPSWYFAAAGKKSMNPGLICGTCHTEFDQEGVLLKLVAAPDGPIKKFIGDVLTAEDWQRRSQGVPTANESSQLRSELKRLQVERADSLTQQQRTDQRHRGQLEHDLQNLLKQSIIEGFYPLQRMNIGKGVNDWKNVPGSFVPMPLNDLHVPLRTHEALRWECPSNKCGVRMGRSAQEWVREAEGMLVVTSERIMHVVGTPRGPQVWQRSLQQVTEAQLIPVQDTVVLALNFNDNQKLVGFELAPVTWNLIIDGQARPLTMTPQDLLTLFYMLS